MNEDIKKPDHLYRFPCMCPWIGSRYKSGASGFRVGRAP